MVFSSSHGISIFVTKFINAHQHWVWRHHRPLWPTITWKPAFFNSSRWAQSPLNNRINFKPQAPVPAVFKNYLWTRKWFKIIWLFKRWFDPIRSVSRKWTSLAFESSLTKHLRKANIDDDFVNLLLQMRGHKLAQLDPLGLSSADLDAERPNDLTFKFYNFSKKARNQQSCTCCHDWCYPLLLLLLTSPISSWDQFFVIARQWSIESFRLLFQLYGHHEAKLDPLGILEADLSGERPEGINLSSHKLSKTSRFTRRDTNVRWCVAVV